MLADFVTISSHITMRQILKYHQSLEMLAHYVNNRKGNNY